jgi:hypothetical protein
VFRLRLARCLLLTWTTASALECYGASRHRNRRKLVFSNGETGETTGNDPRLAPSTGWEIIDRRANGDDPEIYQFIRNKDSGEVVNFDPRMEPEALKTNGIDVAMLTLV